MDNKIPEIYLKNISSEKYAREERRKEERGRGGKEKGNSGGKKRRKTYSIKTVKYF